MLEADVSGGKYRLHFQGRITEADGKAGLWAYRVILLVSCFNYFRPTFRMIASHPSSWSKIRWKSFHLLLLILFGLFFEPHDRGDKFFRNVGLFPHYMAIEPTRQESLYSPYWETEILNKNVMYVFREFNETPTLVYGGWKMEGGCSFNCFSIFQALVSASWRCLFISTSHNSQFCYSAEVRFPFISLS